MLRKHAKKTEVENGIERVVTDKDGKQLWKTSSAKYLAELISIRAMEVEIDIVVVDAKLLDEGVDSVIGALKRDCEFMFTNCPWDDEEELDLPDSLKEYSDNGKARPEPEKVAS